MSARSRYLAAISPREASSGPVETNRKKFDSLIGQSKNAAPPPPPPPGPPPAKKLGKRRGDASEGANKTTSIHNQYKLEQRSASFHSTNSNNSSKYPKISFGNANSSSSSQQNVSSSASHVKSQPQDSPHSGGGEVWSPKDEITSGNVARFKQLWGGGEGPAQRDDAKKDTFKNGGNSSSNINEESNASSQRKPQGSNRAPPSTPPRPSATSRSYNNNNSYQSRISTRSPSPPKYKLNAPPSLKLGMGSNNKTAVPPPSRVFHSGRPEKSPGGNRNPSPLRQRASGLNLAPIDTSFGGSEDGNDDTIETPRSNSSNNKGDALSLSGASPSPANIHSGGGGNQFPFEETKNIGPSTNNNNTVDESASPAREPISPNPPGIFTITSFNRPNAKVGIVFTRQSRSNPDVCVISKITPDSIFRAHEAKYAKNEGSLKGAEVIAVNGIPVREARHAAELVAGCAEEVRLTIRRAGGGRMGARAKEGTIREEESRSAMPRSMPPSMEGANEGPNKTMGARAKEGTIPKEEPQSAIPRSMPPSMEGANEGPNKTISFDEEDELVKTEEEKKDMESEEKPEDEGEWSKPKSTESQDVIERRRQIAQAMIVSSDMVDDPIPTSDKPVVGDVNGDVTAAPKGSSPRDVGSPSTASAIERRRLAAMKMYQSQEMVEDNVDDVRLGTIDAISPRETIDPIGSFPSSRFQKSSGDPFGDNASVATTNVTTSSVATQRMGSNNINAFFTDDAFSPANPHSLKSPQAQRRKERAAQRIVKSNSFSRLETASPSTPQVNATSPTASRSPVAKESAIPKHDSKPSIPTVDSASQIRKDDESVAVTSIAGSAAASTAAISETSGESRGSRSLFGKKKKKSGGESNPAQPVTMKKKSIFGVANLIRKVNSRNKGKFSKKGQLMDDSSLFREQEIKDPPPKAKSAVNENHVTPATQKSEEPVNEPPVSTDESTDKSVHEACPKETIPQSSSWGSNKFFEDAFASSAFNDPNTSGNDAFGFPEPSMTQDDSGFFDDSPDAWGEPSSLKSSLKPVDFTPRRNNFSSNAFDNDAMSYDASEMSEVTDPTFATQLKPDGDDNGRNPSLKKFAGHIRHPSQGSSSQEQSEAAVPLLGVNSSDSLDVEGEVADGTESLKEDSGRDNDLSSLPTVNRGDKLPSYDNNSAGASDDPPLATLEDSSDEEDNSLNLSNDTLQSSSSFAKSRIMEKYSKAGRLRKPIRNDNRTHPPPPPSAAPGSLTMTGSKVALTRSIQPEIATGMHSKQQNAFSTPPRQRRDSNDSSSIDSTLARRSERIQRTNRLNQEKREAAAESTSTLQNTALPNTSLVYKRRMKSSSPALGLDKSINNSFSSESRNRKKDVYAKKKVAPSIIDDPNYYNMEEKLMKIKDPIQRAGVRLLWAAAIPIQTQARRFLARQIAIRRMCGILTIQAFVRRWLAERDLEIAIWSVIQILAVFRGWYARDSLEDNHYCATQIQRVVRGYLATMHVFEDFYSITIVQSVIRMHLAINEAVGRLSSVIAIQAWYRGCSARYEMGEREYSAIAIQSNWRRYLCQMNYQFDMIDIIIVQNMLRRRNAIRQRELLEAERNDLCAVKIQSAWRSYDCSMTFVHILADIITVQSVVRRWGTARYLAAVRIQCFARVFLSKKRFTEQKAMHYLVTRHVSATQIQSAWRSYCAQVQMLIDIVNIIVIQSLWRRRTVLRLYKPLLNRIKLARERTMAKAATKIQSAWRAFIVFSSCLILRYENQAATTIQSYWRRYYQCTNYSIIYYEIIKIQAAVRGHQQRSWWAFQEDCATIIQAYSRRFLERKDCHNEAMINMLIAAASNSLRMRNAARKLQRWWLDEMWSRREKEAALIIERFFINVKAEVEAEIAALKKKKEEKRKLRKLKQSDEWILERAWLNTMEEPSFTQDETTAPQQQAYRPPVPNSVGRMYAQSSRYIQGDVDMQSDVSGLTNSPGQFTRKFRRTQIEIEEDVSLEEAFHDSEHRYAQNEEDAYLRRHGYSSHSSHQVASRSQNHSYRSRKAAM